MSSGKVLITGAAGFIGFHVSKVFLDNGYSVIGIDNINDYYTKKLKLLRLDKLKKFKNFQFIEVDFSNDNSLNPSVFFNVEMIIHLGAQAGVRESFINPKAFTLSNIFGFENIINLAKELSAKFIYASSSSVYGDALNFPISESQPNNIKSYYALTKQYNEMLADYFWQEHKFPSFGLRFFTVYGPYGRPDMAYFSFADSIWDGREITLYNDGSLERDMTYIDDIASRIFNLAKQEMQSFEIYNIGGGSPVSGLKLVQFIEEYTNRKAKIKHELKINEVKKTFADTTKIDKLLAQENYISFDDGMKSFLDWFKNWKS